jgi:glycosyltransferase involved in cell wall biosynthesis
MLVRRELFNLIGGFDEQFTPGNYEDDDFCLRLVRDGYRNLIVSDVFIHHHGSKSHDMGKFNELIATNKKKLEDKWSKIIGTTISAVLIVKDEEANIEDCLEHLSVTPEISEIIVVDTGSTDKTKEIAARVPMVKLYDFPWCDDFSAARNFANSKATKDWILSVDADEVITGLDKVELSPFHAYRIETRNYNNNPRWAGNSENIGEYPNHEKGSRWFSSTKVRLWPNDKRVQFEYPVHEVVENSIYYLGMRMVDSKDVIVHHYGRLNDNYEYGRGDKYLALLHKQLASGKNDLRSLEQLALQMQSMKRFAEARDFWKRILAINPDDKAAHFNTGHCFAEEGDWEEALVWSRKALEIEPESKEAAMNVATCEAMAGDIKIAEKMCKELAAKYPLYPLPQGLLNAMTIKQQAIGG